MESDSKKLSDWPHPGGLTPQVPEEVESDRRLGQRTVSPQAKNLDVRGFDSSSGIPRWNYPLILRGGIPRSVGNAPEIQTRDSRRAEPQLCGPTPSPPHCNKKDVEIKRMLKYNE